MSLQKLQEQIIVPVMVELDGESFEGQARNLAGWAHLKIFFGEPRGARAREVFRDDKEFLTEEQLIELAAGKPVEMRLTNVKVFKEIMAPLATVRPSL